MSCLSKHETQEWLMGKEGTEIVPNIRFLGDGEVYDICGVKFGVCGGNYSYKSYTHRRWTRRRRYDTTNRGRGYKRKYLDHIMPYMIVNLLDKPFDVLLTHEAPMGTGIIGHPQWRQQDERGNYLPLGCPGFNVLIDQINPKYHFHGHHHTFRKSQIGDTAVYCLDKVDELSDSSRCMLVLDITGE